MCVLFACLLRLITYCKSQITVIKHFSMTESPILVYFSYCINFVMSTSIRLGAKRTQAKSFSACTATSSWQLCDKELESIVVDFSSGKGHAWATNWTIQIWQKFPCSLKVDISVELNSQRLCSCGNCSSWASSCIVSVCGYPHLSITFYDLLAHASSPQGNAVSP